MSCDSWEIENSNERKMPPPPSLCRDFSLAGNVLTHDASIAPFYTTLTAITHETQQSQPSKSEIIQERL